MPNTPFDVDSYLQSSSAPEDDYLFQVPEPGVQSDFHTDVKKKDDIVDLALRGGVPLRDAAVLAEGAYAEGDASEAGDANRFSFVETGIEEAQRQMFNAADQYTLDQLMGATSLQDYAKPFQDHPAKHEMSIELVNKGEVTQASVYEWQKGQLAAMFDRAGGLETLHNWAGLFFWPDWLKDIADLTDTSIVDAPGRLKQFVSLYQQLTPEQKMAFYPVLEEKVLEATEGNELKASIQLLTFLDPSVSQEIDINTTLGAVDWALIGTPILLKMAKLVSTVNSVSRTAKLASQKKAGELTVRNLEDTTGGVADTLGVSQQTAGTDAHPGNFGAYFSTSDENLTGATAEALEAIRAGARAVDEAFKPILDDDFLKIRLLSPDEQSAFQKMKSGEAKEYFGNLYKERGWIIDDATPVNVTEDGFDLEIKFRTKDGVESKFTTNRLSYTTDGILKESKRLKAGKFSTYFLSPEVWLGAALKEGLVAESTLIGFQQSRLAKMINLTHKEVWTGTSKAERGRVDRVLQAGSNHPVLDADGKVTDLGKDYSYAELQRGVDVGSGEVIKLTDKEITTFYKAREVFENTHVLLNKMQREVLVSNGFWEATAFGRTMIAKPFFDSAKIDKAARSPGRKAVLSNGTDLAPISKKRIDEEYGKGNILVRLHEDSRIAIKGHGEFSWAFVPAKSIKNLRANPVKRVAGYVPRIYDESPYVVMQTLKNKVDGVTVASDSPVRLFSSRVEANQWASAQGKNFYAKHRSEVGDKTTRDLITQEAGGLFIDERGRRLLYGLDGAEPKLVSALDAMDRQLSYLAQNLPMGQWRVSVVDRWEKAAAQYLPREAGKGGFNARLDGIADPKVRNALEASRRWIRDQLMLPTPEERLWTETMVGLADWMDGKSYLRGPRNVALSFANKDPFGMMRAVSFHALLGMMNPAQLIVQAQGFAVAAALDGLNPVRVANRTRQYLALRALAYGDPDPATMGRMAKAAGWTPEEFGSIVQDFRKSGLLESVRTTADLSAIKMGFHADNKAWGRILNANIAFYREGELFTRHYAFLVARDVYTKKHGLNKATKLTDRQLIDVVELTTKKMFNLNRAARAEWQKGVMSIPTQYWQITARFLEAMMGKKFTRGQKGRILAGQMVLYGAAAVPFGRWIMEEGIAAAGGDERTFTEVQKAGIRDGIWAALTEWAFDEGVQIGQRGAAVSGLEQTIRDMFDDRVSTTEMAFGPFGQVALRGYDAIALTANFVFNPDVKMGWTELEITANEWAKTASSWSNAHKAYVWWKMQGIQDQYGRVVGRERVDNLLAVSIYKALGFSSQTQTDIYELGDFVRNRTKIKGELKKEIKSLAAKYFIAGADNTTELDYKNMRNTVNFLLRWYPEDFADEVWREASKELWEKDDIDARNFRDAMKTIMGKGGSNPPGSGQGQALNKLLGKE